MDQELIPHLLIATHLVLVAVVAVVLLGDAL